jgi:hypothetical protein
MIPQQAMSNDPLSPHTPSPLPADADATVTGTDIVYLAGLQPQPVEWLWQHRLATGTLAMLSANPGDTNPGDRIPVTNPGDRRNVTVTNINWSVAPSFGDRSVITGIRLTTDVLECVA